MPEDKTNVDVQPSLPEQPIQPVESPVNPFFSQQPQPVETPLGPVAPVQEPSVAPVVPRRPVFSKKKILIIGSIIAALIIAGGAWFFVAGPASESALARQFRENSPYEFKDALVDVAPDRKFEFSHSLKPAEGDRFKLDEVRNYVDVYSDAALTSRAAANVFILNGKITVNPTDHIDASDPVADEEIRISNDGEWGLHGQYYIVQYVDLKSGEKLKKPLVTPFSVKKEIEAPVVSFRSDENGLAHFSWTPIEGAERYYVVKLDVKDPSNTKILGQTEDGEWTYESEDASRDESFKRQNYGFKDGRYTNDDLLDEMYRQSAEEEALENGGGAGSAYGVIAVKGERFSSLGTVDAETMKAQLPLEVAFNTSKKMGIASSTVDSYDKVPTHMPIVMVDNSITLRSVIIDPSKSVQSGSFLRIAYVVKGTTIAGTYTLRNFDPASAPSEIERIAKRNIEAQDKTGDIAKSNLPEIPDLSSIKLATTKPSVPYKIYATNPLTEYLAANMLKGERFIDVSEYVNATSPVKPLDAAYEAVTQNPLITYEVNGHITYIEGKKIIVVDYAISPEEMTKKQKALDEEAKRVVASVIKNGMNDKDKVRAINDYIVTTAAYNYDAVTVSSFGYVDSVFSNSWSPYGILLDKLAVCVGYADAFKLLADYAGLEAVEVLGTSNGTGHAWNKVKIDGQWKMIDVTWNDMGDKSGDEYFLITDKVASEKRVNIENKEWIADALVGNYAAK